MRIEVRLCLDHELGAYWEGRNRVDASEISGKPSLFCQAEPFGPETYTFIGNVYQILEKQTCIFSGKWYIFKGKLDNDVFIKNIFIQVGIRPDRRARGMLDISARKWGSGLGQLICKNLEKRHSMFGRTRIVFHCPKLVREVGTLWCPCVT